MMASIAADEGKPGGPTLLAGGHEANIAQASAEAEAPPGGVKRRAWEWLRDECDIIQDSKWFQHLTTLMIVMNAIVLAITW